MTKAVRGIYAAAISPLLPDGRLDADRLVDYCRYLLSPAGGCNGVAPTGTTGEGTSLALSDKLALPETFAAAGIEGERVIFGTGTSSLGDCATLAKTALMAGFPNVLVLPPFYYKNASDDGLFAFYARLIEAVGSDDLRVFLYHFPQMSATPLSPDLVVRLRREFGAIIAGLKDSSGDFEQSRAVVMATGGVNEDFDVYPSSEAMLWDGLEIGTAGIISGSTNAFGALAQAALQAPEGPDRTSAMEKVSAARAVAAKYNMMAAMKRIEAWRSGDDAWLRLLPPLRPLSDAQEASLKSDLDALELEPALARAQ